MVGCAPPAVAATSGFHHHNRKAAGRDSVLCLAPTVVAAHTIDCYGRNPRSVAAIAAHPPSPRSTNTNDEAAAGIAQRQCGVAACAPRPSRWAAACDSGLRPHTPRTAPSGAPRGVPVAPARSPSAASRRAPRLFKGFTRWCRADTEMKAGSSSSSSKQHQAQQRCQNDAKEKYVPTATSSSVAQRALVLQRGCGTATVELPFNGGGNSGVGSGPAAGQHAQRIAAPLASSPSSSSSSWQQQQHRRTVPPNGAATPPPSARRSPFPPSPPLPSSARRPATAMCAGRAKASSFFAAGSAVVSADPSCRAPIEAKAWRRIVRAWARPLPAPPLRSLRQAASVPCGGGGGGGGGNHTRNPLKATVYRRALTEFF